MGTRDREIASTPALRLLKERGVSFRLRPYDFKEKGGAPHAAKELGVEEHLVIKTLVMEDEEGNPLIVLMHGDREVSTKALARAIGAKRVTPCDPEVAQRHTGYLIGGISPFGTRKVLPVYVEESILELPRIFINAGRRGLMVELSPQDLLQVLHPKRVRVARGKGHDL